MKRASVLLVGMVLAIPAAALEGEAGFTYERLDHDLPDWKSAYLELTHDFAARQTLHGLVRETDRFDQRDTELAAGYYHPFGAAWTALVEASASPDHHVLPKSSLLGQMSWIAGAGWVASAGLRYSEYTEASTRLLIGTLERYFGAWRAGYTLYNGKPEDAGSATTHRVALDHYYYGERSRIGVGVAWGREVEHVGPPVGLITSDVRAVALLGRHWITPGWALTWEAGTHEQGDLYRRTGVRLGLRHHF